MRSGTRTHQSKWKYRYSNGLIFFSFSALKIDVVWVKKFKELEDLKEVILKYDKSTQKNLFTQLIRGAAA